MVTHHVSKEKKTEIKIADGVNKIRMYIKTFFFACFLMWIIQIRQQGKDYYLKTNAIAYLNRAKVWIV